MLRELDQLGEPSDLARSHRAVLAIPAVRALQTNAVLPANLPERDAGLCLGPAVRDLLDENFDLRIGFSFAV